MINFLDYYAYMNDSQTGDMFGIAGYANQVSNGLLFPLLLLTIFFIILLGTVFSGRSVSRGLLFAGFVCSILSILLTLMNWLNSQFMYLCFFITAGAIVWVWLEQAGN